ncbi:MAG: threonylcarbamoyl-AMP synthase [Firmicutes bacterium]|nr:threonylcarbamoyl-AMP synthase [Bacillota bacterium]
MRDREHTIQNNNAFGIQEEIETKILTDSPEDIAVAGEILKGGGLVAFPTETVYGLGADAMDLLAVSKIYRAKGRPSDNPMIVHIAEKEWLKDLALEITPDMEKLMDAFWPGPMTMVVKRQPNIPDVTTGGLDTVGIRFPSNPVARALIKAAGCPVAAPSANLSGKPSPTTSDHVIKDLKGRVDAIIKSGDCLHGIESTVIDMTGVIPMILRPGVITQSMLSDVLGKKVKLDPALNARLGENYQPRSPGMKYKHYAPQAEMKIYAGERPKVEAAINQEKNALEKEGKRVKVIVFDNEVEAARDLFALLRAADDEGVDVILAASMPEVGLGFSVMNRMLKSAGYNVTYV